MTLQSERSGVSLSEVHHSVKIPEGAGVFKRVLAFIGPAYLVSVGYMDPGNWATDLEGGARFGYQLIWVLLMSNLMAVLLQTLSARMGIVTGRDLAQACRDNYPKPVAYILWVLCEIAIAACDLAEVLGTAIGLNLLFGLPLIYGVIITGFDTMLLLVIQNYGIRKMEAMILMFISTIGISFIIQVFLAGPVWGDVLTGFIPRLNSESLYVAIGILGATVMPHNLYLHSALVQTRIVGNTEESKRIACKYNFIDTTIALNAAFFVNAAILIVAAAVFFTRGVVVTEIQQAHELLSPLMGTALAGTLFGVALVTAGQSSTLTGTLAGQIVMEGFLKLRVRPFLRRLITRLIAIVPAVIVISLKGDRGSYDLLIMSQVILSIQLPFAVIPLIRFTSDKQIMGVFVNKLWVKILAWIVAGTICLLNSALLVSQISNWISGAASNAIWLWLTAVPIAVAGALLQIYISLPKSWKIWRKPAPRIPEKIELIPQRFSRIGVAIDYSPVDPKVLSHAQSLAKGYDASLFLFHIVEGVGGQLFGSDAFDDEAREDKEHLESVAEQVRKTGVEVTTALGYGRAPEQIVKLSKEMNVDLLVMGGHGHTGLKDLFFGTSVSKVRHGLAIPVLVVQ
ncbi:MAG: Nramp family divalent metal transporter [Ignavibacteriales bacterium]|nr:Nramp family divalent metal transporter [Ignavibacteriales bacterium]